MEDDGGRIIRDRELGHQLRKHARGVSTAKCSYLCRSGYATYRRDEKIVVDQDVRKFVGSVHGNQSRLVLFPFVNLRCSVEFEWSVENREFEENH